MPAHDLPYVEPAGGQNPWGRQRSESLRLGPIAGDGLAGGIPLQQGTTGGSSRATQGRRPGASLPGPAAPASAAGGRSHGSPAPEPPDVGIVRATVACSVTAMAGSGRRPGTGGPLRGTGQGPAAIWREWPVRAWAVRLGLMSDRAVTGAGLSGARFPPLPRGPGSNGPP